MAAGDPGRAPGSSRPAFDPRHALAWLAVFGLAFGYVEAAVVVYLRALRYPQGFAFPIIDMEPRLAAIEVARETATLVMLWAVASLAAPRGWRRFGAFAVAFGFWDLAYYLGLRAAIGWPESLQTWDVLFLIPGIWTGPVWSAAAVAALLVLCGARILLRAGEPPRPRAPHWAGAVAALALLLAAFLWNHTVAWRGGVPESFPAWLWAAGVALGVVTFAHLFR